jgi:hypothetical protein
MRTVHGAYAPAKEPFGTRLELLFIHFCVALGDIDGKPFSVAKIAAYMWVPRTAVMRRLRFSGMDALMTREAPQCHRSPRKSTA